MEVEVRGAARRSKTPDMYSDAKLVANVQDRAAVIGVASENFNRADQSSHS